MFYNEENKLSERFALFVEKYLPVSWQDTNIPSFEEYCAWRDAKENEENALSDYDTSEEWDETQQWNEFVPSPTNSTRWDDVKSTFDANNAEIASALALKMKTDLLRKFQLSDEEIKKLL